MCLPSALSKVASKFVLPNVGGTTQLAVKIHVSWDVMLCHWVSGFLLSTKQRSVTSRKMWITGPLLWKPHILHIWFNCWYADIVAHCCTVSGSALPGLWYVLCNSSAIINMTFHCIEATVRCPKDGEVTVLEASSVVYCFTGWGKITSLNFKVNNRKTLRDTKILFLDSETTTWEVLSHTVLKRISCKWWPLLSIHCCSRIQIFCITLSNISCGMRATSRRIASFSACRVLGRCLNTSTFRHPHKK